MFYQATPRFTDTPELGDGHAGPEVAADALPEVLDTAAEETISDEAQRARVVELARTLLGSALATGPGEDEPTADDVAGPEEPTPPRPRRTPPPG